MMEVEKNDLYDYGMKIYQAKNLFKFSIDSILLSEFVDIRWNSNLIVDFAKRNFGIGVVVDKFAEEKLKNKEIYQINIKEKIKPRNICIIKKDKLISKASNELLKFIINK